MPVLTMTDAATALREGTLSSVDLTRTAIEAATRFDSDLGAYLCRFDESALVSAARADEELAAGVDRGPLHGIPFALKDIIACTEGPTVAQSTVLDPAWGHLKDAPVVRRLKAAGAVITGKTTTMEFAVGVPDPTKPFPIPRNPWNRDTWAGGSSSGSASGVTAGMFLAALGTDTAGSIRIPAAYCGVTGLMPTFGRVPKSGVVPLGYSLDHVGPIARSARDCAAVLQAIAGPHRSDPSCVDRPVPDYLGELGDGTLAGLRIGVIRDDHFPPSADPALAPAFDRMVSTLTDLGADVRDTGLPYWSQLTSANVMILSAEALAYHRTDLHRWPEYFSTTRSVLARGALVSGADYVQAQRVRRVAQQALAAVFSDVDAIVCPTVAGSAPAYGELDDPDLVARLLAGAFTGYWDCVGNPVIAAPLGFTSANMPLSFQVAGRPFEEATVLRVAAAWQLATDHHVQAPTMTGVSP